MTQTMSAATPTRLVWNVGIRTNTIPNITGATPVMATLAPFELLSPGVYQTQGTDPVVCNVIRHLTITVLMNDADILDPTPLKMVYVLEQSLDDGRAWLPFASGRWQSDPATTPRNPGDPLPRPNFSTNIQADGQTRRFRGRIDIPQSTLAGIDITVS